VRVGDEERDERALACCELRQPKQVSATVGWVVQGSWGGAGAGGEQESGFNKVPVG